MIIENICLHGFILAKVIISKINEKGKETYITTKTVSTMIECPAIKKTYFDNMECISLEHSDYDYDMKDIEIIDKSLWKEILTNGHSVVNLEKNYIIKKIIKIYEYDLEE